MLMLNVPYAEKDEARGMGARWDAASKRWYVPRGVLAAPFERWMPPGEAAKISKAMPRKAVKIGKRLKATARAPRRSDDEVGIVIVGAHYRPLEGATGPPWA